SGLMFFGQERPAGQWIHAEQREEIDRDLRRLNSFRLAPAKKSGFAASIRGHLFEDVVLFGPFLEVGIEHAFLPLASTLAPMDRVNHDEAIGGRERQRPQ